jgi:NADH-quinone oxidoreductase subunit I
VNDAPSNRRRGVLALRLDRCTACMVCARECPDWCIHIEAHPEAHPDEPDGGPRRRARTVLVLDRFAIDFGACMYCGICVEVCPHDALAWAAEHDRPASGRPALTWEAERLESWWPGDRPGASDLRNNPAE